MESGGCEKITNMLANMVDDMVTGYVSCLNVHLFGVHNMKQVCVWQNDRGYEETFRSTTLGSRRVNLRENTAHTQRRRDGRMMMTYTISFQCATHFRFAP